MIILTLDDEGRLSVEASGFHLRPVQPVLNGVVLSDWRMEQMPSASGTLRLCYRPPDGATGLFGLEATLHDGLARLRYWLEGLPAMGFHWLG